jgi:hypothetical protein
MSSGSTHRVEQLRLRVTGSLDRASCALPEAALSPENFDQIISLDNPRGSESYSCERGESRRCQCQQAVPNCLFARADQVLHHGEIDCKLLTQGDPESSGRTYHPDSSFLGLARRSDMLAGSALHAIGRPRVSTRMWRLRPLTRLCAVHEVIHWKLTVTTCDSGSM